MKKDKQLIFMNETDQFEFIGSHLKVNAQKKKSAGEVFTSYELVSKTLDLLPPNVWKNPNLKWIDPTAGVGNFLIIVYQRLLKNLSHLFSSSLECANHIITRMIFAVEIDKENSKLLKRLFYTPNIFCGDVFQFAKKEFDCIVGNPPFNQQTHLHERVVSHCLEYLFSPNDKCAMAMIVPDTVFSGGSFLYKRIISQPYSVSTIVFEDAFKGIVEQPICYFALKKTSNSSFLELSQTNIWSNGKMFKTVLQDRPVNPVRNWNLKTELLVKKYIHNYDDNENTLRFIYNRGACIKKSNVSVSFRHQNKKHQRKSRKNIHDKPPVHLIYYGPNTIVHTNTNKCIVAENIKKIILFGISNRFDFAVDLEGKYSVGPNSFYVPVKTKKEADTIVRFLQSDDYKELVLATKTSRHFLKVSFVQHLRLNVKTEK
jgi:predicted RNA methylase